MIEHSSVFFVFSKSKAIFQKVKKNTGSLVAGLVSSMVRSKVRVEGSLRPMRSLVAGQIRSTSTLNPHTPEVEGRGWAQGRESRRLEVKSQAGGSRASVVVEARGWGSGLGLEVQGRRWSLTRLTVSQLFNWGSVLCNPSALHKKSDQESPRYIHRTKQYSYMFKMSGDTTLENPLTREKCDSQISIMHVYPEHQENAISNHFVRTIKRTQWKLSRKRKDRSLSEFRPSRLNQHAREGTR